MLILVLVSLLASVFDVKQVESMNTVCRSSSNAQNSTIVQGTASTIMLATLPFHGSMAFGPEKWNESAIFTLSQSDSPYDPRIGDELWNHWYNNSIGMFDFNAENEPDFNYVVKVLTNGNDDTIWLNIWCGGSGGGQGTNESVWGIGNPDLIGYNLVFIRLIVHSLLVSYFEVRNLIITGVQYNCSWEIWGNRKVEVVINPRVLNLWSRGKWTTAYIKLPKGFNVRDINVSSILLNDTIRANTKARGFRDYGCGCIPDLIVRFDRAKVTEYILDNVNMTKLYENRFMTITLTVTGKLNDGTPFQGSDTIKIIFWRPPRFMKWFILP